MEISAHIVKKKGKYDRKKKVEHIYESWAYWTIRDLSQQYTITEKPFELAKKPEFEGYMRDGIGYWKVTFIEREMIEFRKLERIKRRKKK